LFVALLSSLGAGTKSLFRNESSFEAAEVSNAKIKDTALLLWKIYLVLTVSCALGLKVLGMCYFSNWETGFAIEMWIVLFMLLGSISFLIYVVIINRNWKRLRREEEAKWYLILLVVAIVLVVGIKYALGGKELSESLRGAIFTVVSIASSTGYGTADFELWPVGTHFIILGLMLMGGCAGSTAGGAKVSRIMLLVRSVHQEIVQAFRPHQVFRLQVNGNPINDQGRSQTVLFVALFWFIAIVSMMVVAIFETARCGPNG